MEIEKNEYNVKLPSSTLYVTVKNIWKLSKIIAMTGRVFTVEDLVNKGSPVNEKNLFRILSYMRYLGLLNEKREKIQINGKTESVQKWYQDDSQKIADFFFYLQDNRMEEARNVFCEQISNHEIFRAVSDDLMKNVNRATIIELKDFLRRKTPGKGANYYTNGAKFLINLLEDCGLISVSGDIFELAKTPDSKKIEPNIDNPDNQEKESPLIDINNLNKGENKFIISIVGDNTNFQFPINQSTDLDDVELILQIIRKKLT